MQPEERDAAYLWDILDAGQAIVDFTAGMTLDEYLRDRKVQLAVERAIEIIGEAARRVSDAFKQAHPEVPWRSIIAQRNVLAHEYGDILPDRIWVVATVYVPDLVRRLRPWLPEPPGPEQ